MTSPRPPMHEMNFVVGKEGSIPFFELIKKWDAMVPYCIEFDHPDKLAVIVGIEIRGDFMQFLKETLNIEDVRLQNTTTHGSIRDSSIFNRQEVKERVLDLCGEDHGLQILYGTDALKPEETEVLEKIYKEMVIKTQRELAIIIITYL
jgi:hypothetical protein